MTLTKEWLLKTIAELEEERDATPGAVNEDAARALAAMKRALASLEAEPVAYIFKHPAGRLFWSLTDESNKGQSDVMPVYTAQPAPVFVPDELTREEYKRRFMEDEDFDDTFRGGWKAHRAAMLQGADGNSPVIPDGWVMVPVEPTAEMLQSGISAHYERSQIQIHDRPAPGPMECAYVAMIAAAPQQEVK
ncbi:hypothetical protein [Enterobacter hormaechei]|uniref:hypothetical protein n=1 Tax=Enterobacter hormaechei TaxID=158836 RepID=UPI0007DC1D2C|nr:hypothetical protein [Enterobacter hormaechei]OAR83443.1 hypothetical protein AYO01_07350 [Enterobacter hormaechei]